MSKRNLRVKNHEKNFDDYDFNWELMCKIPRIATLETKICIFQYFSLSLTLSIVIFIISTRNAILEKKEKATGWEGGFTNKKVWTFL